MNAGRISRIQVFEAKNMPGRQEAAVRVVRNGGIEGDRHCMDQEKQISIMWEDASCFVEEEEIKGLCFSRIKANLMIEGRMRLEVGDKIRVGSALLLITDRKGACFDECGRYKTGMDCMLKDCCWFATALEDGEIRAGDLLTKPGSQEYDWQRYERQMMVPGMGREAQERLERASVLVVGAGGLGCPVLTALAEAGVGRIGIMDGDVVERSNLNRQYLYTPSDIGKRKAACAGAWLQRFRPDIELEIWEERLTRENGKRIVSSFDLVICAVDKVKTRLLINRLAKEAGKPNRRSHRRALWNGDRRDRKAGSLPGLHESGGERTGTYKQLPGNHYDDCRSVGGPACGGVSGWSGAKRRQRAKLRWNLWNRGGNSGI